MNQRSNTARSQGLGNRGQDSDEEDDDEENEEEKWQVQTVQGIPMTTNLIAVGYTPKLEFSFVIKPSPDSK